MATLLLIRHAEHEAGMGTLAGRMPGVKLSELGRRQAAQLVLRLQHLPIRAIYSSPLERTVETATAIAQSHGLSVQIKEDLLEVDFGAWTGMTFDQLRERADWLAWNAMRSVGTAPGGEFMLVAQIRAVQCVLELARAHEDQCIAAVSHGDIIRAVAAYCLGVPLDNFQRIEVSLASVTVIKFHNDRIRVLCTNNTAPIQLEA